MNISQKDYIWSYISVILSLCSGLLLLPFVMYFLDADTLGLWYIFQNLAAITVLFDFGFSVTFSRNINYCYSGACELVPTGAKFTDNTDPNYTLMKKAITACRMVFLIISVSALVIMLSGGMWYIAYVSKSIPKEIALPAWGICSVAIFMNLYFGYYGSFLRGVGDIADANRATVYSKMIQIILTIVLLFTGCGIIGTSIAYLTSGTMYRQLARRYFYRYRRIGLELNQISERPLPAEIVSIFKTVWHNAWRDGIVSLSTYLSNQAGTIICSLYMPLSQTGAYSLAVQLVNALGQLSTVAYSVNQPVLQSSYITNDKERMRRTMSLIVVSFVILYICGTAVIASVGLPILRLIRPETIVGIGLFLGIALYQMILRYRDCFGSYFSCTNRIPYVSAYIIASVYCVIASILFMGVFKWGVWGLIGAQISSQAVYNGWIWSVRAHKELELSVKKMTVLGLNEIRLAVGSILNRDVKKT